MSNFQPSKVTAIKRNQLYLRCHHKDKKSIKVQLEKKMPKIQNCYLGQTRNLYLVNHPEVSTWEIWSCYNKNSDERNQHSHYMDTRQSERWNFIEIAKILNFRICHKTQHATHLLKLVDKICKYEMDAVSILDDTLRTRFCPQTDRWTDGQGETSVPPFNFVGDGVGWGWGYNKKTTVWNG